MKGIIKFGKSKALILSMLIFVFVSLGTITYAETSTITVNGTSYTLNTGDGSDGDVMFDTTGMYINGSATPACTPNGTIVTAYSDQFESTHSDVTYNKVYVFENIIQYLPVHKTYSPSTTVPGGGTVPQFKSLTIKQGVALKGDTKAINFCVQGILTVEGIVITKHGAGGVVSNSGKNGGNAAGPILIAANEISVSPNGTNASTGAIMAGWGGGGAGSQYTGSNTAYRQGGAGGIGGAVIIYANTITNNGEIRAGNGGGGGGGAQVSSGNGGAGGAGGVLTCVSKSSLGSGVYASGFGGGGGSASGQDWDHDKQPGCGGYNGGGNGGYNTTILAQPGKSANSSVMGYGGYTNTPANYYTGSGPAGGNGTHSNLWNASGCIGGTGGTNGTLSILCEGNVLGGIFLVGYTEAGGTKGGIDSNMPQKGSQTRNIVANKIQGRFPTCKILTWHDSNYNEDINDKPTMNTSIKGTDVVVQGNGNYITIINSTKTTINGELILAGPDVLAITGGDVIFNSTATFVKPTLAAGSNGTGDIHLGNMNIGTSAVPVSTYKCYAAIGTEHYYVQYGGYADTSINIYTTGDARLAHDKYKDDTWCKAQKVTINGLKLRGVLPSSAPNAMGVNEVNFSDWIDKYNNPSGTLPIMKFIVEKQTEGETNWTATAPFERNLSGVPAWQDNGTVAGKNIIYKVGFKNSSGSFGFIYLENNSTASSSEGGLGLDSSYKGQSAAYWAYQGSMKVFTAIQSEQPFTDCVYDKLVDTEVTAEIKDEDGNVVGTLIVKPISVFGTDYTYTKLFATFSEMNNYDSTKPFRGALIGGRLILFKTIAPPNIADIATVTFQ